MGQQPPTGTGLSGPPPGRLPAPLPPPGRRAWLPIGGALLVLFGFPLAQELGAEEVAATLLLAGGYAVYRAFTTVQFQWKLSERLDAMAEQVHRLAAENAVLREQLARLAAPPTPAPTAAAAIPAEPPPAPAAPPAAAVPPPAAAAEPTGPKPVALPPPAAPPAAPGPAPGAGLQLPPPPGARPAPVPTPAAAPPVPPKLPRPPVDWGKLYGDMLGPLARGGGGGGLAAAEARVGGVWIGRIGALLLIIGAVFAYRFLLASPYLRALIGYLAGVSLLGLGWWGHRKEYRYWAQAVTGGGLGLLYATTTGAVQFLDIMPPLVGFAIMSLVTVAAMLLAVHYDATAIGVLGAAGGYATPFLMSTGQGSYAALFTYMAILNLGLLGVAYFRRWHLFNQLSFVATWGIFALWRAVAYQPQQRDGALLFATVFFLIFCAVSVLHNLAHRRPASGADTGLAIINGLVYFLLGLNLLGSWVVLRGFFAFGVAAVYFTMGALALARHAADRRLVLAFLGQAVVYLTVAFPVALSGSWITIAWAVEGAVLVWVGFLARAPLTRYAGLGVLAIGALRLVAFETAPFSLGAAPPALLRIFTFGLSILAYYAAARAYARFRAEWQETEQAALPVLLVAANGFSLWWITLEVVLWFGGSPLGAAQAAARRDLVLAGAWGLYGLVAALAGLQGRSGLMRTLGALVLGFSLLWFAGPGLGLPAGPSAPLFWRLFAFLFTVGATYAAAYAFRRRVEAAGDQNGWLGALALAAHVLTVAWLGLEIALAAGAATPAVAPGARQVLFVTKIYAITAGWSLYGVLAMAAAVWLRSSAGRLAAGAVHVLAILTVLAGAEPAPTADYRLKLAAFVATIGGAYLSVYLAGRAREHRPALEVRALAYTAMFACLATAATVAAQLDAYGRGLARFGFSQAPGWVPGVPVWSPGTIAFATALWLGLYALAVLGAGLRLRSAEVRGMSLFLQGVALFWLVAFGLTQWAAAWPLRLAAFLAVVAGIYAGAAWSRLAGGGRQAWEAGAHALLALAACLATLPVLAAEFHWAHVAPLAKGPVPGDVYRAALSTRDFWALLATGLYGLAVLAAGARLGSLTLRHVGRGIQALAATGALWAAAVNPAGPLWLRLGAYAAAFGGLWAGAWWLNRRPETAEDEVAAGNLLSLGAAFLGFLALTAEVYQYFSLFTRTGTAAERGFAASTRSFALTAAWVVYGFAVLVAGFVLRSRRTRFLGLGLFMLAIAKVFVTDIWSLASAWRIWITVGLGMVLLLSSFFYQRFWRLIAGHDGKEAA